MNVVFQILNFNDSKRAIVLAERVCKYSNITEVVIVDNCSTLEQKEILNKYEIKNNIKIIFNQSNVGYGRGNNIGLNYCNSKDNVKYVFISNTDVIVEEKTINQMIEFMEENEEYSNTGSISKDLDGNIEKGQCWRVPTKKSLFYSCFFLLRKKKKAKIFDEFIPSFGEEVVKKDANVMSGSFQIYRMDALNKINFFDEKIFMYYEEDILTINFRKHGYKQAFLLSCSYIHNHPNRKRSRKLYKISLKSARVLMKDYMKASLFTRIMFFFCCKYSYFEYSISCLFKNKQTRRS